MNRQNSVIPFFFIRVTTNEGLASIRAWMSVMDLEIWYEIAIDQIREKKLAMATTSEDVWRLLAELATAQAELTAAQKETDKQLKEVSQQQKKTDKQLKELGQQIGGLGAKFGSFTEGLALPSMEKILRQRFGMEVVSPSVRVSKDGKHLEIDVLAYTNGQLNTAYIVEVKSHAREESISQLKSILQRFRRFFPEHKDKKLYGILAAVHVSPELREKILQEGLYVARIHDQVFELDIPDNFQPRLY